MKKEYLEHFRHFCTPFLAAANTAAAGNFSNFLKNILKDKYSIFKHCKFQKGGF
jgi:hypothetical protein